MTSLIQLPDFVALTHDISGTSLLQSQVGTVVEVYPAGQYEVEFSDDEGRTYALEAFGGDQLIGLRYRPTKVAS